MDTNIEQTASCACKAVSITVTGQPQSVVACHCLECQKRTGSVFGVGAYYKPSEVKLHGITKSYSHKTDSNRTFTTMFCPNCGTSICWHIEEDPTRIGIAVGAFADPEFPKPVRSVWEQSKHHWVSMASVEKHFPKGRQSN